MKLIRCYIENFGGLQQYEVSFSEGLTVICEPNGFGKTTLAEFIRAMFYGFPRNYKDITKNPRLKYLPWQGGRFGGYLIFEHNGKRYRIDRSFGDTPKGDKFKLINEDTKRETREFTSDIGVELFGLDSESFMRSTYMPQIRDNAPLNTDQIRAKLGNLLEDTGDMGNYDRALQRLREKRTTYEHFRGSGGSIWEAQRQITLLQQQIRECEAKAPQFDGLIDDIAQTHHALNINDAALQRIRTQLSEATTAEAVAARAREYEALSAARAETAAELNALQNNYPKGLPSAEELNAASKRIDDTAALEARLRETPADLAAEEVAAANSRRFAAGIPSEADFIAQGDAIDRLTTARSSLQNAALTEAEATQLAAYREQFAPGIPDDAWFTVRTAQLAEYTECKHLAQALAQTAEERDQLTKLTHFFASGLPTKEWIADCDEKLTELTALQHSRPTLSLPEDDKQSLQRLESYFEKSIPTPEALEKQEQQLTRAEALRHENLQLSAAVPSMQSAPAAPQKKFHSLFFPALILGILAAAAGIALLSLPQLFADLGDSRVLIGAICAAVGGVSILAAVFMQNNFSLMSKLQTQSTGISFEQRSRIDENAQIAAALEASVAAFLADYPTEPDHSLRRSLSELRTNYTVYLPLRTRADRLAAEAEANDSRTAALTTQLQERFSPYFSMVPAFADALQTIKQNAAVYPTLRARAESRQSEAQENAKRMQTLSEELTSALTPYLTPLPAELSECTSAVQALKHGKQRYLELTALHNTLTQQADALRGEISALQQQLTDFLLPYCGTVPAESFRQALDSLRRDADSYTAATAHLRHRAEALQARDTELARLLADHNAFCAAYALHMDLHDRQALKDLERDAAAHSRLLTAVSAAEAAFQSFVETHGHRPAAEVPEISCDLEGLKEAEQELIRKQNALHTRLVQQEQRSTVLRGELDKLPALKDELTRLTEQKAEHSDRRRLLDETLDYLQKARESLSANYLGGVQGYFAKYLNRMTGEKASSIAVNTDLEVQLERAGSSRSLVHFSAGQTDAVHLCMRLALADALFGADGCFMILDDPFVNLDDAHTEQALALLEDLSEDRQIVYLVCNTNRTP